MRADGPQRCGVSAPSLVSDGTLTPCRSVSGMGAGLAQHLNTLLVGLRRSLVHPLTLIDSQHPFDPSELGLEFPVFLAQGLKLGFQTGPVLLGILHFKLVLGFDMYQPFAG